MEEKKEKTVPDNFLKTIYDIIEQIYKNEESHTKNNNKKVNGFLVKKNVFDEFKEYISYKDLVKCVKDKKIFGKFIKSINTMKKYIKFQKLEKQIKFTKFENSQELVNDLCTNHNEYYIINNFCGNKIMGLQNKSMEKEKEIEYKITKDNIYIYFKSNDNVTFKFNKNILIGESNLIQQKNNLVLNTTNNPEEEMKKIKNNNKENILLNKSDNILRDKYKAHIEILLRLLLFQKENKDKGNQCNFELKEQKGEPVFLIKAEWVENFEEFFECKKIEEYILKKQNNQIINSKSDDKCFENLISNLPNEYFNKLEEKTNKIIDEKKIEDITIESYKIKSEEKLVEIKCFSNFQILNSQIYGKLMSLEYIPIKADSYYLGNNKLLLSFQNQISCDEIGYINEKNIFIPENILYYAKPDIAFFNLSNFFKNNYDNNTLSKTTSIYDDEGSVVGYCYSRYYLISQKMTEKNKHDEKKIDEQNQNENSFKQDNDENISNNIHVINNNREKNIISSNIKTEEIINDDLNENTNTNNIEKNNEIATELNQNIKEEKEETIKNENNQNQEVNKETEDSQNNLKEEINKELEEEIKAIIEIILLIYKFENEIEKELTESSKKDKYNIKECILIKQNWIDKFFENLLSKEIKEYLEQNDLDENIINNIEYIFHNCIKDKSEFIEICKKSNLTLTSNDIINSTINNLTQSEKNKEIYYPKDFYFINEKIYLKLLSLFKIENINEEKNGENYKIKYIINNEKIIFSYCYSINKEKNDLKNYNILICQKIKDKFELEQKVIEYFENNEIERDKQFNNYTIKKYSLGNSDDIDGNIVIKYPLKEKKINLNLSILIKLFLDIQSNRKKLKQHLTQNLRNFDIKEYYLIDHLCFNDFLKYLEYERLIPLIKFDKDRKADISEIKKDKMINDKINEIDNYKINTKLLIKFTKQYNDKSVNYYNNFEIIDEQIKYSLEKLLKIKLEKKAQFLIGKNKFCAFINDKNIVYLGTINQTMTFNINILVKFNDSENFEEFKEKLKTEKFSEVIKSFYKLITNDYIRLSGNEGFAIKIKLDKEFQDLLIKSKEKIFKTKGTDTMIIFGNNIKSINKKKSKKILENKQKSQKPKENIESFEVEEAESTNNNLNLENNEEIDGQENVEEEHEKSDNFFDENNEKKKSEPDKKINEFYEKQIRALIAYFFFIDDLNETMIINSTKKTNFDSHECYLIDSNWMENLKNFFLYTELVSVIKMVLMKIKPKKEDREEVVYQYLLNQDYIRKLKDKENSNNEENFEKINYAGLLILKTNDNIFYPTNFEIISPDVYNKLEQRKNGKLALNKKEFIINSQKIILKFKYNFNSSPCTDILIGKIDFKNFQFIPEKIIKCQNENDFKLQFNLFKAHSVEKVLKVNQNEKKIFNIIKEKQEEENKIINNELKENIANYAKKINIKQNEKNIQFLFKLHIFTTLLKYELKFNKTNNNQFEKCYLIKKDLIDIYNNCYDFDNIIKNHEQSILENIFIHNEKFNDFYSSLIKKYEKHFNNKDLSGFNTELITKKKLFKVEPIKYNETNLLCFENCLIYNEPFENEQNENELLYTIIENKIILIFNLNINIGIIEDKKNIFVPEIIIKFLSETNLNDSIQLMENIGIIKFVNEFYNYFDEKYNTILSLNFSEQKINKKILVNNFIDNTKDRLEKNKKEKLKNNNSINNNNKLNFNQINNQEKIKENERKKKKVLKNILSILFDIEIVKKKMNKSLKGSKEEIYYLLNIKWLKKYIELKNIKEIVDDLSQNKIIESYINSQQEENILYYNSAISDLMRSIVEKKINAINNNDDDRYILLDKDLCDIELSLITISEESHFFFFNNFILISAETKKLLSSEFPSNYQLNLTSLQIYFGDNKIFIIFQYKSKNIIEICHINNKNVFQPAMLFYHQEQNNLIQNIKLLTSYEFKDYSKYFLLFDEDYISPIFDLNNNRIGQAFRYDEKLDDYSKFISKENKIKYAIKLYFSNYILLSKFNNKINEVRLLIINENYVKNLGIYSLIQNKLNQVDLTNELKDIITSKYIEEKLEQFIEGKKISLKMKSIMSEQNDNFIYQNAQIESDDAPNLLPFYSNGKEFFYFDNFRLIDISLANKLLNNKIISIQNLNNNIIKCITIENYLLLDISDNNKNIFNQIYEVCEINEQNIIKPMYILAYLKSNYFNYHINYIFDNLHFSFNKFLNGLQFSQGNGIDLTIDSRNGDFQVGFIYKLSVIFQAQNQNQIFPSDNNISINNSNINIINNNPNININISCNPSFQSFNQGNNNISNISNVNFGQNQIIQSVNPMPISDRIPERIPERIPGPIDSIDKEYITHPLVGLKNVGATCYMNATLQCFLNLKKFVNFFKYKLKSEHLRKIKNKRYTNLTESFKYLIENVWMTPGNNYYLPKYNSKNANNRYFIPKKFKEKISIMNPLFEGAQANDAKDLVNFLIMTLHEELNKADNKQNANSSNILIDQSNRDLVLKNFSECFVKENMSLISDLFYAMNNNVTECCNCHNKKYNFQIYFFLNFPLEEVRKFKIQMQVDQFCQSNQNMYMMNQMMFQQNVSIFQNNLNNTINTVNLDDCFLYNQKIENFSGPNAMYCNSCKIQANAYYRTLLSTGPEILVIILNRGKGKEFDVKCDFVQQLNLSNYIEMKNTGFMYDLVGVVTHMGESGGSGHFIAVCRSPIDQQQWYKYNDDLVFPVGNFVTEVINYAMPYILFYQKKNK